MKFSIILMLCAVSVFCKAQTTDELILKIRKEYNTISAGLKTYKKTNTKLDGDNIVSYQDKNGLYRAIFKTSTSSTNKEFYEYYYNDEQRLIFCYLKVVSIKAQPKAKNAKPANSIIFKYYVNDNEVIRKTNAANKEQTLGDNETALLTEDAQKCMDFVGGGGD